MSQKIRWTKIVIEFYYILHGPRSKGMRYCFMDRFVSAGTVCRGMENGETGVAAMHGMRGMAVWKSAPLPRAVCDGMQKSVFFV